ncbi:hypothetical protein H0H92_000248 [Tricholoma furcatifolium]|nr:hypothetical protein H0H92_000248 [Tricholoma furcatifolium]
MPRQYSTLQNGLQDIAFNWDPENRLSVERISKNIDYLAATEFQRQLPIRHLVIVAASTPFEDVFQSEPTSYGTTRWQQLALKVSQANIQCHLVLSADQDMRPFITLFEETLRLQNAVEDHPQFPVDSGRVICRLSRPYANIDDNMYGVPSVNEPEAPQSLVAQLQQVHGLTKKKVYGAKPVPLPFVREERVHQGLPNVPTPLVIPSAKASQRHAGGGRAVSTSKAARVSRMSQNSPTELQSRRPGMPRRNSRMSSPEVDPYPSASSFPVPPNIPSPVSPIPLSNLYAHQSPIVPSQAESINAEWGPLQSKTMLQSQSQPCLSQSYFLPYTAPPQSLAESWQDNGIPISPQFNGVSPAVIVPFHSHALRGSPTRSSAIDRHVSTDLEDAKPLARRLSYTADDEPFTIPAEFVAATAAMFKAEVLPDYPELQTEFPDVIPPRRAFFIAQDQSDSPSPSSAYDPGELYNNAPREECLSLSQKYSARPPSSQGLSYATSYSPGSSSSLTGWAG